MLTHTELFWSLPSPRAFCRSITEAALGARAILINTPFGKTLEYGVMEGLRNANIHQPLILILILIIEDGTNISNTLAPHFGNEPIHANQLAAVQVPQPQAIILRSTTERSYTHCSKYMTEFIEEITKTTGNLRLMVSLQDKTIKKNMFGNMSTDQFAVVVYDGTLMPEEMQAYVSYRMLGREELGSTSLIRHLVTDFASYDVALADRLIQMSRDEILGLPNALTRLIAEDENRWLSGDWLQGSESLTSPTERHPLREWYLASHSSPLTMIGRTAAEKRYWRACLKAISPWLEEHRPAVLKELCPILKQLEPSDRFVKRVGEYEETVDWNELEFNDLCYQHRRAKERSLTFTSRQSNAFSLCHMAKSVRNELAHSRIPLLSKMLELVTAMDDFLRSLKGFENHLAGHPVRRLVAG